MKEKWLLVCGGRILATCMASSHSEARQKLEKYVSYIDWSEGDVLSEADYMAEMELNSFESTI